MLMLFQNVLSYSVYKHWSDTRGCEIGGLDRDIDSTSI